MILLIQILMTILEVIAFNHIISLLNLVLTC